MNSAAFSELHGIITGYDSRWLRHKIGPNEWRYLDIDDPELTKNLKLPQFKTVYSENSFSYTLNSNNFRCGELANIDITKPIFLVAGCSVTFGTGLPAEHTWGRIIFDKLKLEFPTAQFINLAFPGTSLDFATRMLSCIGDLKHHIDCCVILSPEVSRREFSMDEATVVPFMHLISGVKHNITSVNYALQRYAETLGIDDNNNKYNLNKNLCIIDLIHQAYGCEILIDSWTHVNESKVTIKDWAEEKYKKYFLTDENTYWYKTVESCSLINGIPECTYKGRDGIHDGEFWHRRYANGIFNIVRQSFVKSINSKGKMLL